MPESKKQRLRSLFRVCVLLQVWTVALLGPIAADLLRLQLCFKPESFRQIVRAWSLADLECFRRHFLVDAIYPVFYGAFLREAAAHMLSGPTRRVCRMAALLGAVLDVLENAIHMAMLFGRLGGLERADSQWVIAASTAATIKWTVTLPVCAALGMSLARAGPKAKAP